MKTGHNDLFRFVSVRGPEPVYTTDPTKDVPDVQVLNRLSAIRVDLRRPDPKIPGLLTSIGLWSRQDIDGSRLAAVQAAIDAANVRTMAELTALTVTMLDTSTTTVRDFATSDGFRDEYGALTDSWLTLILTNPTASVITRHEELLRVAHLVHLTVHDPSVLGEGGAVRRLRAALVVPPQAWTPSGHLDQQLLRRHETTLAAQRSTLTPSKRSASITKARTKYGELVVRRETVESILVKSRTAYLVWKKTKLAGGTKRTGGLLPFFPSWKSPAPPGMRAGQPLLRLDADFYARLHKLLTPREKALYDSIRSGFPKPDTHAEHDAGLAPETWTNEANKICHQIKLWEDAEHAELPDAGKQKPGKEHPLVRAVSWGELVVARERLIGYEAREIAHIENVMPGESKRREHERRRTVEQMVETETLNETESERDLETTDRYELQTESQTVIQEEYSIQAGLNTSGKYGLTHVNTSLQAGMQQSKSEARSSSQTLAREVVSKAVERTFERVRELRRQTITEQIRELNRHTLKNMPANRNGAQPADISGIYLWVEKLLEVELRHYGTRMLVEFHIPEPAVSLLERRIDPGTQPRKPAPFTLSPSDIQPENYLCLTATYGAQDVEPPPPQQIFVGYSWATTPNEESDAYGQDARADTIAIPADYRPLAMTAMISTHPGKPDSSWPFPDDPTDVFMAIGGEVVVELQAVPYGESGQALGEPRNPGGPVEIDFDPSLRWPAGVPVVLRAAGHWDNTLVAEATVRCWRTEEALNRWRLRVWEQLSAAHQVLMQTYLNQVEQQALQDFGAPALERPDAENRRIEAEELRKWAIKAMRLESFAFDAIKVEDDGAQEIDPLDGDLLARVSRFFEEAFEWPQASYFLYPYYWGRRDTWKMRAALTAVDPRHAAFLRAGAARYIVPVTPGYEERVVRYLETAGRELDRLGPLPDGYTPEDPTLMDLWLELLLDRRPELALGSGTLNVTTGFTGVTINADSNWHATDRDLGRELYIDGDVYAVAAVTPTQQGVLQQITLDENFKGIGNASASYATGSVPYGPPWVERVPTSLVILEGSRARLASLAI
ncbi:hypothetical protein [Streptomyces phaeochromogenes]